MNFGEIWDLIVYHIVLEDKSFLIQSLLGVVNYMYVLLNTDL